VHQDPRLFLVGEEMKGKGKKTGSHGQLLPRKEQKLPFFLGGNRILFKL
jgi:hypothetical protein